MRAQEFLKLLAEASLFEINMGAKNLRRAVQDIDALAGMEFEMIVPNVETDVEPEWEPDMDQDERARSFSAVRDFFHDGDYNGRRAVDNLMEELQGEYEEWQQEQTDESWKSEGIDYMRDFVEVNDLFDRDEALDQARDEVMTANPDLPQESEDFQKLLSAKLDELQEQFVLESFEARGRVYNDAFETFAEEQREEYDERSFFDDQYQTMSDIQSNFDITWPHYYNINDGQNGDVDIDQVADEFGSYMGKPVNASQRYHGARREAGHYVVEPDGSLKGDNPGDSGLEFVSPPMPVKDLLADLAKVKRWADKTGAYTNDSTGLHINISVPNYSIDKLDYTKLAILMGDEYVLELFGRTGNTYAKSAMDKIKTALKTKPESAAEIMKLMKKGLDGFATKAIHSGITEKYTSINTKTGYIEFRSPGGDWLDTKFDKIENTLMRFTVALNAAIDPEAYRKEYLTKLYKLLSNDMEKNDSDIIQLFSNYSAGDLDKAALIRQVRQKQLARNVAKGKATGKMWWKVSNPANSFASIEVVASSKEEAIDKAIEPGNYPDWARVKNTLKATPLRPYTAPTQTSTVPQGSSTGNWGVWVPSLDRYATIGNAGPRRFESEADAEAWIQDYNTRHSGNDLGLVAREVTAAQPQEYEVFDRDTGATVDTFTASNDQEVARGINDYRTMGPHDLTPEQAQQRYGLRRAGSTPIARQPQFQEPDVRRGDLTPRGPGPWEIYRLSDNSSVRVLSHTDRPSAEVEARMALGMRGEAPELYGVRTYAVRTPQPAQEWTGAWLVLNSEGRVLQRFTGIGNVQADANRHASNWLRSNPRHMQAGVTVVPEMA
jgi:Putative amidoligase enzyme